MGGPIGPLVDECFGGVARGLSTLGVFCSVHYNQVFLDASAESYRFNDFEVPGCVCVGNDDRLCKSGRGCCSLRCAARAAGQRCISVRVVICVMEGVCSKTITAARCCKMSTGSEEFGCRWLGWASGFGLDASLLSERELFIGPTRRNRELARFEISTV